MNYSMSRELVEFAVRYSDEEDEVLKELDRETNLKALNPQMLSGHLQGRILEMFSKMTAPRTILEIGTYTGYASICLARGLQEGGCLHTIEANDELKPIASKYFSKAGLSGCIVQHTGNALNIIPQFDDTFDLVFIDGEKSEYCEYYDLIFDKVKSGGLIIADNVLWYGKVAEEIKSGDRRTAAILRFHKQIKKDIRVSRVILPYRDGLMLIRKK